MKGHSDLRTNKSPLEMTGIPEPIAGEKDLLIKVTACGVCHTDMDIIEGRTKPLNKLTYEKFEEPTSIIKGKG